MPASSYDPYLSMAGRVEEELPAELEEQCDDCHNSLSSVERLLKPFLSISKAQNEDKLGALDKASQTLLLTYCINSLFWVYLVVKGVDPKTHLIKQELERVQKVMKHAQSVSQKASASGVQVDSRAAKRFIRSALWEKDDGEGTSSGQQEGKKKIKLDN